MALYQSMKKHSSHPFILHVLAMDDVCYRFMRDRLEADDIRVTSLSSFEVTVRMRQIRSSRTWQEYCWTCASNFMEYLMRHCLAPCSWGGDTPEELTYLDADMLFFGDPEEVHWEIGGRKIAIIPHRFPLERKHMEVNGKFNVSWVTLNNGSPGSMLCAVWAAQCRDWCFYRNEDGKFADQGYLDAWPERYGNDLCIVQNPGAGLAPWNLGEYMVAQSNSGDGSLRVMDNGEKGGSYPLVFFHYHEFVDLGDGTCRPSNYPLREIDIELIYKPYITALKAAKETIRQLQ